MDVKPSTHPTMSAAMAQAHVDPEKGRQGDFEHWQRIFDASNRPAAAKPTDLTSRTREAALRPTGGGFVASAFAAAASMAQAIRPSTVVADAGRPQAATSPVGSALVLDKAPATPFSQLTDAKGQPRAPERSTPGPAAQASRLGGGSPAPDGRPVSHFEAHLSRGADGRLSVALRSNQPLSTAQALHAVAQALAEQEGATQVDQVFLNGKSIYRSAATTSHRFEIDC